MKAFAETFKECVFYEFIYIYIYIYIYSLSRLIRCCCFSSFCGVSTCNFIRYPSSQASADPTSEVYIPPGGGGGLYHDHFLFDFFIEFYTHHFPPI